MDINELMQTIIKLLPNALFDEGLDGELIIITGVTQGPDGQIIQMEVN